MPADRTARGAIWAHGGREYLHVERLRRHPGRTGRHRHLHLSAPTAGLQRPHPCRRGPAWQPDGTWLLHECFAANWWPTNVSGPTNCADAATLAVLHHTAPVAPARLTDRQHSAHRICTDQVSSRKGKLAAGLRRATTRNSGRSVERAASQSIAMIMMSAPFVFGRVRTQSTGQRLAYGVGFGIVFSLMQQIFDHLGLLLRISPALTASGPSLAVIALALISAARRVLAAVSACGSSAEKTGGERLRCRRSRAASTTLSTVTSKMKYSSGRVQIPCTRRWPACDSSPTIADQRRTLGARRHARYDDADLVAGSGEFRKRLGHSSTAARVRPCRRPKSCVRAYRRCNRAAIRTATRPLAWQWRKTSGSCGR